MVTEPQTVAIRLCVCLCVCACMCVHVCVCVFSHLLRSIRCTNRSTKALDAAGVAALTVGTMREGRNSLQ